MLMAWLAVLGGFALLVWSAERFVMGASAMARNLGVTPLIIGMTIMGFGTSAPEMLVAIMAAANGNPAIGIGNALGSNIANIGLVIGATALIMPMAVESRILKREYPVLFLITLLVGVLLLDNELGRVDGMILVGGSVLLVLWLIRIGKNPRNTDPLETEFEIEIPTGLSMLQATFWTLAGLVFLVLSSRILVWGAVDIARDLGISDLVIGLTIIAVGTSLPELAASVMSALKKEHDMAIGNIIGSNMFNLLAVMAFPGIIMPSSLESGVLYRDYPIVLAFTIALFIMAYGFTGPGRINRFEGGLLLTSFAAYMTWIGITSLQ
ncbi:calcium/sodium antiporter [Kaarinaea lacus]